MAFTEKPASGTRRYASALAVLAAVVAVVVWPRLAGEPSGPSDVLTPARHGGMGGRTRAPTSWVFLYTVNVVDVRQPVVLRSARPSRLPDGVEVVAARVAYLHRKSPGPTLRGWPGAICTSTWPPAGYGATEPVKDLKLLGEERVAILLYVRGRQPGEWRVDGLQVSYVVGDAAVEQTLEGNSLDITIDARPDPPLHEMGCGPEPNNPWFQPFRSE